MPYPTPAHSSALLLSSHHRLRDLEREKEREREREQEQEHARRREKDQARERVWSASASSLESVTLQLGVMMGEAHSGIRHDTNTLQALL